MLYPSLTVSRRIRETAFEKRVLEHGPKCFSVYNHMTLPMMFASLEEDYTHLCEHVQLWDVASERQVEVRGPDAERLVELTTPRDLSAMQIGQGLYAPLVDENGGIVNDPIILKLAVDRYWLSIADSDVCLWIKGLAVGFGMDVKVFEPDVSPLAVQGPKSDDLMAELVGEDIRSLRFFWFTETTLAGAPVVIARSGWSGKGGFELYLQDHSMGLALWDHIFAAGKKYSIRAGCPNHLERMESGLLSYGSDMTLDNNPIECGLDRFYKPGKKANYLGREALEKISREGVRQKLVYLRIKASTPQTMRSTWPVCSDDGRSVGFVTSQVYSPRYGSVLAYAYIDSSHAGTTGDLQVMVSAAASYPGRICTRNWQSPDTDEPAAGRLKHF